MALFGIAASIVLVHGDQMNSGQATTATNASTTTPTAKVEVVEETEPATTTTTTTPTANRLLAIDGERQLLLDDFFTPENLQKLVVLFAEKLVVLFAENNAMKVAAIVGGVGDELDAFRKFYHLFVGQLTDNDIKAIKDLPWKVKEDFEIFRAIFERFPCQKIEVLMGALTETVENLYKFDDIINLEKVKEIFDSIKEVGVKIALSVLADKMRDIDSIKKIALSVLADKMLDIASLTTGMDTLNIASLTTAIWDNMSNNELLLKEIAKLAFSKSGIWDNMSNNEELLMKIAKFAIRNSVDFYGSFKSNLEHTTIVPTNCPSKEVEVKEQEAEVVGDVEELDQSDKTEDQKGCVGKKANLLKEHQRFLVETSDNNQEIANSDGNMARGISVMALVALILI